MRSIREAGPGSHAESHAAAGWTGGSSELLALRCEELELALAAGRIGFCRLDRNARLLSASSLFKAQFGCAPDASIEWPDIERCVHADDRALLGEAIAKREHFAFDGVFRLLAAANIHFEAVDLLKPLEKPLVVGRYTPTVMMVVGVNGAGKTTSIGKLTRHLAESNQKVLLAAADTFRAAAREQLAVWADRNQVEIVSQEGGDPAAVTYDAVTAGRARGCDVVIADTAGRLPTQLHLMEELKKIRRVIAKADETAPHEVLLVVDGNTGQNALAQVKAFDDALQLTGLIVTKLDGTAKGGVLAAIARERPVPVYFIGVGEKLEDLQTFNAREFAQALLD